MDRLQLVQLAALLILWLLIRSAPAPLSRWLLLPCAPALAAAGFAAISLLLTAHDALRLLPEVKGWEADAVARAIVSGHGFRFPGNIRWLWDMQTGRPDEFFPTAWVDPAYTYLLAGIHSVFGERAYAAAFTVDFLLLAVIFLVVYRLGLRMGRWGGTAAVALLGAHRPFLGSLFADINNTALAACALTLAVLAAVRYFERADARRLLATGLTTGLGVLICPTTTYYALALPLLVAFHHRRDAGIAMRHALAVWLLAALVVLPWTLRNYATFGEYVLVRDGAGEIAYASTVGVSATFMPDVAQTSAPVPWHSEGPVDAVRSILGDRNKRIAMNRFEIQALAASPPPGYADMNEAQRDKLYMTRAKEFIWQHPWLTLQAGVAKLAAYVNRLGAYGAALLLLAAIGAVAGRTESRSWPATLLVLSYSAIFALVIPYFGRYRAPIEPTIVVLATLGLFCIDTRFGRILAARASVRNP